ncbi:MAG: hypothetical protein GC159_04500 [Phycisphaera sp.]|nr:hypothetical protein [Phycisphaera sp.]
MAHNEIDAPVIGDWVEAYSPGIWQVIKTLSGFYRLRWSLDKPKRIQKKPIVFVKRLVDDHWRKSFRVESCDVAFVIPLSQEQRNRLDDYLKERPDVAADFKAYHPALPGFRTGLGFNITDMPEFEQRRALVDSVFAGIEQGMTNDEILERIARSPLARYEQAAPKNTTVFFDNNGHELRDGDFVFRSYDVHPF